MELSIFYWPGEKRNDNYENCGDRCFALKNKNGPKPLVDFEGKILYFNVSL